MTTTWIAIANETSINAEAEAFGPFESEAEAREFCDWFNSEYPKHQAEPVRLIDPEAEKR